MDHLHLVVHSHWDREWYQPFQRMRARLVTMTDQMLKLLEDGQLRCFHFDGQTIVLEDYLEIRPENARRIAKLVKAGKLQIGPWYLLADSFLASGEALIRNLEIGAKVASRFGKPAEIGYLPDQFGHCAQMPQILSGFGLKAAVTYRGVSAEVNRNRFVWEALDGSEVLTIYLPFGYFNGAGLPSDSVEALMARAGEIAAREREYAAGAPILVMNGTDHAEVDARLLDRLKEAQGRGALSLEVGTLDEYARRLSELPADGMPRVRGELRSPARANILPGVTSARAWIKQRDFQNSHLLERIADPLTALAGRSGRGADLEAYLEVAWRTEVQNHPHDSICGCSIDQVHEDMRHRFDQAAMIGEIVARKAASAVLRSERGGAPALAVFNPTFARRALVEGDAEVEDPNARHALVGADGKRISAAIHVARSEQAFEVEVPAREFKAMAAGFSGGELMGRFVTRFELKPIDERRYEIDLFMSRSPSDLDLKSFKQRVEEMPDEASVRVKGIRAGRVQIGFVADDLAQAGFSLYRLVREDQAVAEAASQTQASGDSIGNERYRLSPAECGLTIEDLGSGKSLELHLEDDGDRGDEYNFDPVLATPTLAAPASASARVIERNGARRRLAVSLVYKLPVSLAPDRRVRASETVDVPVELTATIYNGLERIDFEATMDNRARDHRLRVALFVPVPAREAVSDTNFGVVRRAIQPVEPPGLTEDVYPTAPHRTFTAVESADLSAALMSRGIYEAEVRVDAGGATVLLTLLRSVGWLSRADLNKRRGDAGPEMETPAAQELGVHRFAFGLTTWRGSHLDSDVVQRIQAYAFPPRTFSARGELKVSELQLCGCDNPRIVFSTARAARPPGAYIVRVFSTSAQLETARLSFGSGRAARLIDLAGRPIKGAKLRRRRDGSVEAGFRPFGISTFEVRAGRASKRAPIPDN